MHLFVIIMKFVYFTCWTKKDDPTACWHKMHLQYRGFTVRKMPHLLRFYGWGHWITTLLGWGTATFQPREHLPLKFPLYLGEKWPKKLLSHYHGLIPETNYKHLECFITLGTHSQLRRGQMSYMWHLISDCSGSYKR